jgi:hypothetical protein
MICASVLFTKSDSQQVKMNIDCKSPEFSHRLQCQPRRQSSSV